MFGLVIKKKSTVKKLKAKSKELQEKVKMLTATSKQLREKNRKLVTTSNQQRELLKANRRDCSDLKMKLREANGSNLSTAIVKQSTVTAATRSVIENLLARKSRAAACSIATALAADPLTRGLGNFAFGIIMHRGRAFASALAYFEALGTGAALELAPVEYLESVLESNTKTGFRLLNKIYDASPVRIRAELNRLRAKYHDFTALRKGISELLERHEVTEHLDAVQMQQLKWAHDLLNREPIKKASSEAVMIGVMDYKSPDRKYTSSNLGDYIQTLAMMANLCRFTKPDFDDGSALGKLASELCGRVELTKQLTGPSAKVQLVPVDRDFSSGRSYPGPVWMISNGWYMHNSFLGPFDFPFSKDIKPIFISFHLNQANLMTPETAAYLKACAPIGCRDWTTVYRLRDLCIPAFFSGCLTTTLGTLFPKHTNRSGPTAFVDTKLPEGTALPPGAVEYTQAGDEVRELDLIGGLRDSLAVLEKYQGFGKIVTSRLHCYLPCRSMGMDVDFRPKNEADVRFEGLLDLQELAYSSMREGLGDKVTRILEKILAGATETDVRAEWRDICKKDVAAADVYCKSLSVQPESSVNAKAAVAALKKNAVILGAKVPATAMEIAMVPNANLAEESLMAIASLVKQNRSPLRIHLLLRGLGPEFAERIKSNFPKNSFVLYFCDAVDYGDSLRKLGHTILSAIDRVLLPELLGEQKRVVYFEANTLIRSNLGPLYNMDLKDFPVAAKLSTAETWSSGVKLVTRASLSMPFAKASDLRRRMHALGSLQFETFHAGVLVIDLSRLRRDKFTDFALRLVEQHAFDFQDTLNLHVRGNFRKLGMKWNFMPHQDWCDNPSIVHWDGPAKPWQSHHVAHKTEFLSYREQLVA